jgi:hypothetical protein
MATKMEHLKLEVAHFMHFVDRLPGMNTLCSHTVEHLLSLGMIQVSTAFEQAVAHTGDHELVSLDRADLKHNTNGLYSDAKLATVRTSGYGKSYGAPVTNIAGKTGVLRVQVYERKQDRFYYFAIPRRAYSEIPAKSNIEIPFELDGTPRRRPSRRVYQNWWNYEVNTFELMATKYTRPLSELAAMAQRLPAQQLFTPPLFDIDHY